MIEMVWNQFYKAYFSNPAFPEIKAKWSNLPNVLRITPRHGFKKRMQSSVGCRKLANSQGAVVESSQRAETSAEDLETVQWAVRPRTAIETSSSLGQPLGTRIGEITEKELRAAVKQLRSKRAAVQVPAEYLKAVVDEDLNASAWLLSLMRLCWDTKTTPKSWHISEVVLVYKKGPPTDCSNYRPISLVSVLYKVYAKILLNRLKEAGAEQRISSRQFGFKSGCSTEDALYIVRRRIEQAWASRGGRTHLLALDWRRGFDCISPDRLMHALKRFGLNQSMLSAVAEIYAQRF